MINIKFEFYPQNTPKNRPQVMKIIRNSIVIYQRLCKFPKIYLLAFFIFQMWYWSPCFELTFNVCFLLSLHMWYCAYYKQFVSLILQPVLSISISICSSPHLSHKMGPERQTLGPTQVYFHEGLCAFTTYDVCQLNRLFKKGYTCATSYHVQTYFDKNKFH